MNASVAAGIVLFNPDFEAVRRLASSLLLQTEQVILVDNSDEDNAAEFACVDADRVTYLPNKANLGIAKALNQIMEAAQNAGFEWVLLMDQDSQVPENLVSSLLTCAEDKTAIIAPFFYDRGTGRTYGTDGSVKECITSGTLNRISAWDKVGRFDEWMFIDDVDNEYCDRLIREGWRVRQTNAATMSHAIGNTEIKNFFGKELHVLNHSAFRKYYLIRNRIYRQKKAGIFNARVSLIRSVAVTVKVLCYEEHKLGKIAAIWRGTVDGFKKKVD